MKVCWKMLAGFLQGLVWIRLPNDANSAQQRLSLIFFCLMMYSMVPFAYMAFPAADKRFFKLDSAKGLYSPSAYFLAYNVASKSRSQLDSLVYGKATVTSIKLSKAYCRDVRCRAFKLCCIVHPPGDICIWHQLVSSILIGELTCRHPALNLCPPSLNTWDGGLYCSQP